MKLPSITQKYKNQWVLAKVIQTDQNGQPTEVEPIAHSIKRATLEKHLTHTREKHITVIYTGKPKPRI